MSRKTAKTKTATPKGTGKVTDESREVVPVQQTLPTAALSNIDAFLEATAAESAKFLKFAKGEWLAGQDEEEIEAGTEMVPNIAGVTCGHVKWEDKAPVDEAMTPIIEGLFTPREELGDLTPTPS